MRSRRQAEHLVQVGETRKAHTNFGGETS